MAAKILLSLVNFYQRYIRTHLPQTCRYCPSCSEYAKEALEKLSFFKAIGKIFLRLLRCNQLFPGGHDPLKQ